jgi:hypothetical protein
VVNWKVLKKREKGGKKNSHPGGVKSEKNECDIGLWVVQRGGVKIKGGGEKWSHIHYLDDNLDNTRRKKTSPPRKIGTITNHTGPHLITLRRVE